MQTDPIGTRDDLNLYTYVDNNPFNLLDPLGEAGCADLASQNLTGECFDSTNFKEVYEVNEDKEVTSRNNKFDRDAVGTQAVDSEATKYAGAQDQVSGDERGARIDSSTAEDGSVTTSSSAIEATDATPTSMSYDLNQIAGAEGVVHTHPTSENSIVPGKSDWQPASTGVPSYIAHGNRVVVVEISGGQVRVRVVSGTLTASERSQIKARVDYLQTKGKKY